MEQAPQSTDPSGDSPDSRGEQLCRWIAEARGGSKDALGQLLEVCRGYLLKIANRDLDSDLGGKLGASDLVQETLLEAQNDIGHFRGATEAELLAWLRQILKHNLRDSQRRYFQTDKRQVDREEALAGDSREEAALANSIDTPSALVSNDEQAQQLCRALTRLSEDHRQVIQMRNWQLASFTEIGTRMQRSEDAARKLWVRALERLRAELANGNEAN